MNGPATRLLAAAAVFGLTWAASGLDLHGGDRGVVAAGVAQESSEQADEPSAPGGLSAEEVARRIQKFYKETEDFQASFKQTYTDKAAGETKVEYGKVYFKKPGKMRWDYHETDDREKRTKTLVSDGDIFWVYELEFQQAFKRCLAESKLPTSLKFLMGQGNLLEDFEVEFTEKSSAEAVEMKLVPKESTPKYKKLHFAIDPDAYQVETTTVFGPYGNTNEIEFGEAKLNSNLPDSGFEFEPPESARVMNPEKECGG